jgi:hypothetical protein
MVPGWENMDSVHSNPSLCTTTNSVEADGTARLTAPRDVTARGSGDLVAGGSVGGAAAASSATHLLDVESGNTVAFGPLLGPLAEEPQQASKQIKSLRPFRIMNYITAQELSFLHEAYEPKFWYWEVIETTRRLLLTAVITVLPTGRLCSRTTLTQPSHNPHIAQ